MTFEKDWVREVLRARRSILVSKRDPLKLLTDLFELYEDDFDVTYLHSKQPQFYQILQEFCAHIPTNYEELKKNSRDLAKFFNEHKNEIRDCDVELYYALLNFMDMLIQKHIYFDIIRET